MICCIFCCSQTTRSTVQRPLRRGTHWLSRRNHVTMEWFPLDMWCSWHLISFLASDSRNQKQLVLSRRSGTSLLSNNTSISVSYPGSSSYKLCLPFSFIPFPFSRLTPMLPFCIFNQWFTPKSDEKFGRVLCYFNGNFSHHVPMYQVMP